jgi:hypothetical protein
MLGCATNSFCNRDLGVKLDLIPAWGHASVRGRLDGRRMMGSEGEAGHAKRRARATIRIVRLHGSCDLSLIPVPAGTSIRSVLTRRELFSAS